MGNYLSGGHKHKTKCLVCGEVCQNKKDMKKHIDEKHRI